MHHSRVWISKFEFSIEKISKETICFLRWGRAWIQKRYGLHTSLRWGNSFLAKRGWRNVHFGQWGYSQWCLLSKEETIIRISKVISAKGESYLYVHSVEQYLYLSRKGWLFVWRHQGHSAKSKEERQKAYKIEGFVKTPNERID